jgi:subtilase family serine protease
VVDGQSGWFQMGGTSVGAPQWSGIIAAANSLRSSSSKLRLVATRGTSYPLHDAVYGTGAPSLFDVMSGANGTCGSACTAASGYDAVTGLGSPRRGIDRVLAGAP